MGRKLHVGNLSFDVANEDLEDLFAQCGTCDSVAVITDRQTGKSRGFAFVEMGSDDEAQKAVQELDGHELKGRAIRVSEAREQAPRGGGGGGGGGGYGGPRRGGSRRSF